MQLSKNATNQAMSDQFGDAAAQAALFCGPTVWQAELHKTSLISMEGREASQVGRDKASLFGTTTAGVPRGLIELAGLGSPCRGSNALYD